MNKGVFWKSDWFVGLLVMLLFIAAFLAWNPLKSLENKAYDMGVSMAAQPAGNNIVIVAIDDDSIDRMGRWPWPRVIMAKMIERLSSAGARLIGVDVFFSEVQTDQNLQSFKQLTQALARRGDSETKKLLQAAEKSLDMDRMLVNAVKEAGNVVMPISFNLGVSHGRMETSLPDYIKRMEIKRINYSRENASLLTASKMRYPFPDLAQAVAAMGHLNVRKEGGVVRSEPLLIDYYGQAYPSMSLVLAAKSLNLSMNDITVNGGMDIELGAMDIVTDASMRFYPAFYRSNTGGDAFRRYPFYDVYTGKIPARIFKGKIVLIGATASGMGERFITPVSDGMTGVELQAQTLNSILHEKYFTRPEWSFWAEIGFLIMIGLYLILVLPHVGPGIAAILSLVLLLSLIGTEFILLMSSALWVQTMTAATMLLLGHLVLTTKRYFASEGERQKAQVDSAETNKMLGLSFQSQGMLDMAFDKFRKCSVTDDVLSTLYNLALDFERKRQFNKATSVYEYMVENEPNYKDVQARLERTKSAGDTMIFGSSTTGGGMSSLLITGGAKPTLGRYEISKELGKGAMGTVYQGRDPKINRDVAIKTMALSQEFEADELQEVKDRFFREAETAGRLNHPNIVTIYDAGEEHDLAYIAMELLSGTDLSPFTKPDKLVPSIAALKISGKVAEALHYAHAQGVVHRDIKPANIMLLKNKTVKVTDFGIARITASSKTKTGVVLGTPSYMSPEQLSGKHVDGRSDLFSLGAMLYEMLTGVRPFRGDSMATLMFQIANEPHPDIREHKPDLPENVAILINKLLAKEAEARFATGMEVVHEIIGCLKTFPTGGKAT
ncbi:MAG: serine/threonine-protein kinase [Mariprofundaceae bacterium]|nr:serine/threonine-protein kinase [Mariprofundaceae bacterium]